MPVADLPYAEELTAFRKRLLDILEDRCGVLGEDEDDRLGYAKEGRPADRLR